jgi:hypothetical protein
MKLKRKIAIVTGAFVEVCCSQTLEGLGHIDILIKNTENGRDYD